MASSTRWIVGAIAILVIVPIIVIFAQNAVQRNVFNTRLSAARDWEEQNVPTWEERRRGHVDATAVQTSECHVGRERSSRTVVAPTRRAPNLVEDFYADACAGAHAMMMRISRSAEAVVLTWDDAVEMDIKPNHLTFNQQIDAGKGPLKAAKVTIPVLRVGGVELTDVEARVVRDFELEVSVLGKTFLGRLRSSGLTNRGNFVMAQN